MTDRDNRPELFERLGRLEGVMDRLEQTIEVFGRKIDASQKPQYMLAATMVTVAALLIGAAAWGPLQTQDNHSERIDRIEGNFNDHRAEKGHAGVVENVEAIEKQLNDISNKVIILQKDKWTRADHVTYVKPHLDDLLREVAELSTKVDFLIKDRDE
jgi:hypothetical protein